MGQQANSPADVFEADRDGRLAWAARWFHVLVKSRRVPPHRATILGG
jgi:hypothetical protein